MSLRIWMPLLGTLENKGSSNLVFSNENTTNITVDTAGKIGSCYKRATKNTAGRIISNSTILLNGDLSMCCWAKVIETQQDTAQGLLSNHAINSKTGFGLGVKQVSTTDYRICCSTGNGNSRTYYDYYGTTNIKGAWHHLTLTYDNTAKQFQLWVDGVVEKTQSYTNSATANKFMIFAWAVDNSTSTYFPACMLNDVRVYDHCLSAAEVHELAQGLMLHYKLDSIKTNLFRQIPKSYNSSAYCAYQLNFTENLVAGQQYTLQLWDVNVSNDKKTTAELGIDFYWGGGSVKLVGLRGTSYFTNGHADYIKATFTPSSSNASHADAVNAWFNVYNSPGNVSDSTKTMSIGAWKLEKGDVATPWEYSSADVANVIKDETGYGRDGTIVGTLTAGTDSGRYSKSIYISNGSSNRITTPTLTVEPHAITLNIWFKSTYTTPTNDYHMVVDSVANRQHYEMCVNKGGFFRGGLFVNGARQANNCTSTTALNGNWHMLTLTYDGTNVNRYYDGVKESTTAAAYSSGLQTSMQLVLGRDGPNANYYCTQAYLSDFRIYATALSADDVKLLYNTQMYIDNQQNILPFELQEGTDASEYISSRGILHAPEFIEDTSALVLKSQIKAKEFIER